MIGKMGESIFEPMMPLTIDELSSSPLVNYLSNDDDKFHDYPDFGALPPFSWKIFDFPGCTINDIFKDIEETPSTLATLATTCLQMNANKMKLDPKGVLQHDCMWAGHCCSNHHWGSSSCAQKNPLIKRGVCPPPPSPTKQQSLLKPCVKTAPSAAPTMQHTPQTPPESDDEENKAHNTTLLKLLNDAINECDSDLTEYFESKEEEVKQEIDIKEEFLDIKEEEDEDCEEEEEEEREGEEEEDEEEDEEDSEDEVQKQRIFEEYRIRTQLAAENDHSYHKDKNAAMRHTNYGLDTPSDSEEEEEIDVVSVSDKFTSVTRTEFSLLPTNPSSKVRHQLQRRVATAISRKNINNGIKTILPVRNAEHVSSAIASNSTSLSGKRGVKRVKNTKTNNKRRKTSDPDREPADKRHLHNNMERQRRVDLRIAFENLKALVPEVSGTKKIAKVNILSQAAQYCYYLTGVNAKNTKELDDLKKRQSWLRSRLSQLRRNLAAVR